MVHPIWDPVFWQRLQAHNPVDGDDDVTTQ
jgi:hypothetical protein